MSTELEKVENGMELFGEKHRGMAGQEGSGGGAESLAVTKRKKQCGRQTDDDSDAEIMKRGRGLYMREAGEEVERKKPSIPER